MKNTNNLKIFQLQNGEINYGTPIQWKSSSCYTMFIETGDYIQNVLVSKTKTKTTKKLVTNITLKKHMCMHKKYMSINILMVFSEL